MTNFFSKKGILFAILALTSSPALHAAHLNAPQWDVYVADQQGHPLSGVTVEDAYQDYSCESQTNRETLTTDASGHVQFAPKYLRRNPIKCVKNTASSLGAGAHASLGRNAFLVVSTRDLTQDFKNSKTSSGSDVWAGSPRELVSHIVMRPMNESELKWQALVDRAKSFKHSDPRNP